VGLPTLVIAIRKMAVNGGIVKLDESNLKSEIRNLKLD